MTISYRNLFFICFIFSLPLLEREYEAAKYNIIAICVLLSLAIIISHIPFKRISVSQTDVLFSVSVGYLLCHHYSSENASLENVIHLLYYSSLYLMGRVLNFKDKKSLYYTIIAIGLWQTILVWLQYLQILPSNHLLLNCTGSYLNPSMAAAMIVLAAIVGIHLLPVSVPFMLSAAILTDCRTSWIVIGIALFLYMISKSKWGVLRKTIIGIILLSIALPPLYLYKQKSADSRIFIWKVCTEIAKENIIFGNGPQAVKQEFMHYQKKVLDKTSEVELKVQASNNNYAYNEFLRILCEYGLIGVVLLCGIIYTLRMNKIEKYVWLGFLIISLFSYPLSSFSLSSFLILFLALSSGKPVYTIRYRTWHLAGITGVVLLLLVPYWLLYKRVNKAIGEYYWDKEEDMFLSHNYPYFKHETELVSCYAKTLFYAQEYQRAIPVLKQLTSLSPTSEVYCDLGLSYQKAGLFHLAEESYEYAASMVPGYIIPQYRLFKLYMDIDEKEKALEKGKQIEVMPLKVENPKTIAIKEEVSEFIKQYN